MRYAYAVVAVLFAVVLGACSDDLRDHVTPGDDVKLPHRVVEKYEVEADKEEDKGEADEEKDEDEDEADEEDEVEDKADEVEDVEDEEEDEEETDEEVEDEEEDEDEYEDEDEELPDYLAEADEMDCPVGYDKWLALPKYVNWNTPNRAFLTLPPGVKLAPSLIPGAGSGIFATTFIAKYTWLGEYEGQIVADAHLTTNYACELRRHAELEYGHYVDAFDEKTSSWLRWINCSRHKKEENVKYRVCMGKFFYMTERDVHPGEELLVFYGDQYAKAVLGIDLDHYDAMDIDINLYKKYAC